MANDKKSPSVDKGKRKKLRSRSDPKAEVPVQDAPQDTPTTMNHARHLAYVFGSLLFAVIALAIVFASGKLRFADSSLFVYVVYVLAGLLSAALCYGFFTSIATVVGGKYGVKMTVGGPAAVLVIVTGGGMSYERWFRTPELIQTRIVLVSKDGRGVHPTGTITVTLVDGSNRQENITSTGALFQNLPRRFSGTRITVTLEAPPYVVSANQELLLEPGIVSVKVERDPALGLSGSVNTRDGGIEKAQVQLKSVPCEHRVTGRDGTFSFVDCEMADRLQDPQVKIALPSGCSTNFLQLRKPPLITSFLFATEQPGKECVLLATGAGNAVESERIHYECAPCPQNSICKDGVCTEPYNTKKTTILMQRTLLRPSVPSGFPLEFEAPFQGELISIQFEPIAYWDVPDIEACCDGRCVSLNRSRKMWYEPQHSLHCKTTLRIRSNRLIYPPEAALGRKEVPVLLRVNNDCESAMHSCQEFYTCVQETNDRAGCNGRKNWSVEHRCWRDRPTC